MRKTAARLLLCCFAAALTACGGGGDGGNDETLLVQATTTHSKPDSTEQANDRLLDAQSPVSTIGIVGQPYRVRTCITGTWRQTLRAPATLRLIVSVGGTPVRTVNNFAGVAGPANSIAFSGCSENSSIAGGVPSYPRGSASFDLRVMDNRAASPVNGHDLTIEWTVTRVQ